MKFLILLSTWLVFVAIASAQDCPNGRCNQPARIVRTETIYEYPRQPQTRYTVQLEPVPVTVYYYEQRPLPTPIRSGFRRLFGCR